MNPLDEIETEQGIRDFARMVALFLSGPGNVQTVWWQWLCSADSLHYWGPVLLAGSDG